MTEVTRLTEYMEVICNRPYTRDEHYIIDQNKLDAVYNEFEGLLSRAKIDAKAKLSQQKVSNDKVAAFIKQNAMPLYDFAYRIKEAQDSVDQDAYELSFFYRGVNNVNYLIAPYISKEQKT